MNTLRTLGIAAGAIAGGVTLNRILSRFSYSFDRRVVVIAGGSRGLGLAIARQLAREGAKVALLARDRIELQKAVLDIASRGGDALAVPCDITDRAQVHSAVQDVLDRFERIDVLINVAGIIQVGPLQHMTDDDFRQAMDIHLWGPFNLMWTVVPHMRVRGQGRIVNISSIGGKIAVPHMAPYTASKFALVGLSEAFRSELSREGIYVTTVCPGPMRTGSHQNARFKGRNEEEFAWFAIFDSLPGSSLSVRRAAAKIIAACRGGRAEIIFPLPMKLAAQIHGMFPGLVAGMMSLMNRMLPKPTDKAGYESYSGWESHSRWAPSRLTKLADRATAENNETAAAGGDIGETREEL